VQLQDLDEFAHPRAIERVFRVEWLLRIPVFEVFAYHLRLAKELAVDFEVGHFAHGRALQVNLVLRGHAERLLERDASFQQRHLDLVVVIADCKSAQLQHRCFPFDW
jgi:hypothetical protein